MNRVIYPEQLRVKLFIQWVDWQVHCSIYGQPPREILTDILKRDIGSIWQKRYVQMRIDKWYNELRRLHDVP